MPATTATDRGEIIHLAGRHRLSPALRDGAPALAPVGDGAGRCGWGSFFGALDAAGLAVAFDADGSARTTPAAAAPPPAAAGGGAVAEARRFLRALRGEWTPPG